MLSCRSCFRTRGRPRDLSADFSPNRSTSDSIPLASPNGHPRWAASRTALISFSVNGSLTRSNQARGRGIGHGDSRRGAGGFWICRDNGCRFQCARRVPFAFRPKGPAVQIARPIGPVREIRRVFKAQRVGHSIILPARYSERTTSPLGLSDLSCAQFQARWAWLFEPLAPWAVANACHSWRLDIMIRFKSTPTFSKSARAVLVRVSEPNA